MGQRLALPQHLRQPPRSLCTNPVVVQVKMGERLALPQHFRQPPRSLITNPDGPQVKMGQRLALPKHPHKLWYLLSVPPLQGYHQVYGQAPKVLRKTTTITERCVGLLHEKYACTLHGQIPSKLRANPKTNNHPLTRPEVP
eukprot:2444857-Rhodomonas_salina.1